MLRQIVDYMLAHAFKNLNYIHYDEIYRKKAKYLFIFIHFIDDH
jgi:hypothetical protein